MSEYCVEAEVCKQFHQGERKLLAYVPCWPFEAEKCTRCDVVGVHWGPALTVVWKVLIGWWWTGRVLVTDREYRRAK